MINIVNIFDFCIIFDFYLQFALYSRKKYKMNQLINLSSALQSNANATGAHYVIFDREKKAKIVGTFKQPYFCGRDVCEILEYKNVPDALFKHVKQEHKKDLKTLSEKTVCYTQMTFFGSEHLKNLSYNDGKATYINEEGLYSLLSACKHPNSKPFKAFMDQFFYDLRYKSGIMDIFTFMKDKKVAIDVNSPWFQELWYPISKRTHSILTMRLLNSSPHGDASFILITSYLLNWMGYEGQYHHQKESLVKFLQRNNIPYDETDYGDQR
ncbi:MAG: BRO family protein, partial [Cetobacterium sp.]